MSMNEFKKAMYPFQIVDMMAFDFKWKFSPNDTSVPGSETYSVVIKVFESDSSTTDADDINGFVDCKLERIGFPGDNFISSASYYYSIVDSKIKNKNERQKFAVDLAKGTIWTKFYEITRISLNQSGIYNVHIPLIPAEVNYSPLSL
jgi:hypothetical protein